MTTTLGRIILITTTKAKQQVLFSSSTNLLLATVTAAATTTTLSFGHDATTKFRDTELTSTNSVVHCENNSSSASPQKKVEWNNSNNDLPNLQKRVSEKIETKKIDKSRDTDKSHIRFCFSFVYVVLFL